MKNIQSIINNIRAQVESNWCIISDREILKTSSKMSSRVISSKLFWDLSRELLKSDHWWKSKIECTFITFHCKAFLRSIFITTNIHIQIKILKNQVWSWNTWIINERNDEWQRFEFSCFSEEFKSQYLQNIHYSCQNMEQYG